SKKDLLENARIQLHKAQITNVKIVPMGQGNKISRILAWTFLSPKELTEWPNSQITH
ncbi:MAG: RlmF-related methyltransferase, partial [Cytophagales bacterium]|nr:RlmF-related methyltransferase [Cytophagales bacterium]